MKTWLTNFFVYKFKRAQKSLHIFCLNNKCLTHLEHICSAQRYTDRILTIKCKNSVNIKPEAAEISLLAFNRLNCNETERERESETKNNIIY